MTELLVSIRYNIGNKGIADHHVLPIVKIIFTLLYGIPACFWIYLRLKKNHTKPLPEKVKHLFNKLEKE